MIKFKPGENRDQDCATTIFIWFCGISLCVIIISIPVLFGISYSVVKNTKVNAINCTVLSSAETIYSTSCNLHSVPYSKIYYNLGADCPNGYNNKNPNRIYICYTYTTSGNLNGLTGSKFNAQYYDSGWIGVSFVWCSTLLAIDCIVILILGLIGILRCFCCNKSAPNLLPVTTKEMEVIGTATDEVPNDDLNDNIVLKEDLHLERNAKYETIGQIKCPGGAIAPLWYLVTEDQ